MSDIDRSHPLKGIERNKDLKRKRKFNRKHKQELSRQMDKLEKKSCYGKPKGCSLEKRRWRHERVSAELLLIAKLLMGDK